MTRTVTCLIPAVLAWAIAEGREPVELFSSPLAIAFGSAPGMANPSLSPDGSRVAFLKADPAGDTTGWVLDTRTGEVQLAASGEENQSITWCEWANEERLLCGLRKTKMVRGNPSVSTQMVAVNANGSDRQVLLGRRLENEFAQVQDRVVDWLPDDPDRVLVEEPGNNCIGVSRLNIYDGKLNRVERCRGRTYRWIADGHGTPRLYRRTTLTEVIWHVKRDANGAWEELRRKPIIDIDDIFAPAGFGANPNELLYFDRSDGRIALFGMDFDNADQSRVVFSHGSVDVAGTQRLGKRSRLVAARYITDRPRLHFFDDRVERLQSLLESQFPGKQITVFDEDLNRRFYLALVNGDPDSGTYYRIDSEESRISALARSRASLVDQALTPMQEITYPARDGTPIPAYLTQPNANAGAPGPVIVLPHGGPSRRDYRRYDFLAQFFAAEGYTVLQSNFRGSRGYGVEWEGEGGFRAWRQAISDISDGTRYLIDNGIATVDRVCIVGWSFGGYAALMSVIEEPELYQCAASIAGVTDPRTLGFHARNYVGGRAAQVFIGTDHEVTRAGSPLRRAEEITTPLRLFHAKLDVVVPIEQSRNLARELKRSDIDFDFIEYEYSAHDILPERYRIDMLTRISRFLEEQIGN